LYYKGAKVGVASSNTDLHGHGESIRRELRKRIPGDRRLRALDVGTGFGINVKFLAQSLSKGSALWTVDPSKEVLTNVEAAIAKDVVRKIGFVEASADDMPFEDGFFDVVTSVMVLHHIAELEPALKEMARVLRPGGTLLIVDYKPEAAHELEFATLHEKEDFFAPALVARHLRKFGTSARAHDKGVWYLVEARREGPISTGRARGKAGGRTRSAG
jgi:ubiquinone/menaquinone biosynthesis C-methylase UbiE